MRSNILRTNLNTAALVLSFLLLGAYGAVAQQQINLTAGPTAITLPDGSTVPMWGYTCGGPGSSGGSSVIGNALLARAYATDTTPNVFVLNAHAPLPAGTLTSFQIYTQVGSGPNTVHAYVLRPTTTANQYTVVFDSGPLAVPAVAAGQITTFPVGPFAVQAGDLIAHYGQGIPTDVGGGADWTFALAAQPAAGQAILLNGTSPQYPLYSTNRTYSINAVVSSAAGVAGSTATCARLNQTVMASAIPAGWSPVVITIPTGQDLQINLTNNLVFTGAGVPTSLVIVGQVGGGLGDVTQRTTTAPPDHSGAQAATTWPIAGGAGTTPPAQGPRVQSFSTEVAAGATTSLTWKAPRPGTYLFESGTHPSIQVPMGLYGIVVVTTVPGASPGVAYPGVNYGADVPLLFSEIDPVQNNAVNTAVNTVGFSETMVWSGQPGGCGNPTSATFNHCYPPAVNYTPLYYLINGVAFDKTHATLSNFPSSPATGVAGSVLVRLVNAGLRMHIPSIVRAQTGSPAVSGFSLIAEDGNPLPGVARVQSEVFMAAGKTYDVMINAPASGATALPVYDRQLSLSGNATSRDAGMLAYISVNGTAGANTNAGAGANAPTGATLPASLGLAGLAVARDDGPFNSLITGHTFTVSDPSKGVIANDTNVYGVQLLLHPTSGTVTLNANGTFTYTPTGTAVADSFTYCANGTVSPGSGGSSAIGNALSARAYATDTTPNVFVVNAHAPLPAGTLTSFQTYTQAGSGGSSAIGNALLARAYATDTTPNVFVVNAHAPLPAGTLTSFQIYTQVGSGPNTVHAYVLRPTTTANQYTVVFDSGPLAVPAVAAGQITTFPVGPFAVQAGDLIAHYGQGIPTDVGGGADWTFALAAQPAAGQALLLDGTSPQYPLYSTDRTYSINAVVSLSSGSGPNTVHAYVLRPTATANQYAVVFDSGPLAVPSVTIGQITTFPVGPFAVQAGDLIAHYGQGIPTDVGGGADWTFALAAQPAAGQALLLDGTSPQYPLYSTNRTYSISAVVSSGTAGACSSGITATVFLGLAPIEAATGITCTVPSPAYTSTVAATLSIKPPGVLSFCKDSAGYPLAVSGATATTPITAALTGGGLVTLDMNGGFTVSGAAAGSQSFTFTPQNSQGTPGTATMVTLSFPAPSNLAVTVLDGKDKTTPITDYRWIIEEDRTFYIDPKCQVNPPPAGCPTVNIPGQGVNGIVPTLGTNFHTSYMPIVAQGCVGTVACESGQTLLGLPAVCDVGNGVCRNTASQETPLNPSQVYLDPTKRYYISVLPGDAANPFNTGNSVGGHGMGGAPIAPGQTTVRVMVNPTPLQPAKLSVQVFEDDFPLNGEQDAGGGIDVLASNEPGLGGFNIILFDDAGGTGDATGQMTYDMFNMPLSNSLAGTIDPATGKDACPISSIARQVVGSPDSPTGITGMIVTCPKYESDGTTLSPLAGQAVIANLMPGRYGVVATPGADRIARGEEWLQTNTLDGQKAHDSFLRVGEPAYFQEYGPAGYHVSIGFANPAIINSRLKGVCAGADATLPGAGNCTNTLTGTVTTERMSRTPDERLYSSGDNSSFAFSQCYVSVGDPDGEDFAFTKCAGDGSFSISGLPDGNWRVTVFDQWNDMLVDGLSTPVLLSHTNPSSGSLGQIATNQWQANIYTNTFLDTNGNGLRDSNEAGLTLVPTNIRFRDGSFSNFNNTDLSGNAGFNEVFPLFNWYVIETDSTRYKNTGTHVVYDAGGPADGTPCGTAANPPTAPCGTSTIGLNMANTVEQVSLPTNLRVPGAVYCSGADCTGHSIAAGPASSDQPSICTTSPATGVTTCSRTLSTGRIDPPWAASEGWQGFSGQNSFIEFGKRPFAVGENGGIRGHVIYASTRPFDDPQLLLQTSWEPLVPGVTINLYQEGTAPDGSKSLKLIDHTKTSSWDDWAQGFYPGTNKPYMNCPGQMSAPTAGAAGDLFFFSLYNQPMWLDMYNNVLHGTSPSPTLLPNNAQFKCYDGMHNWNQIQPAPYDGMYQFPSVTGLDPNTGRPAGTNCDPTVCIPNPDTTDPYRSGLPMLPVGKYVVEIVVPPGYELVKEEDKNILIGDNYIAPVTQQFGGLANIFIIPDQAEVGGAFNANNAQNPTQTLGRISTLPSHEGDTGSVETFWPCVGAARIVPDYISLFPQSKEVSPFAGATRNLCDRKEVTLTDQSSALAKFYIFTSTHVTAHLTGIITDDFTSEFDPFSPSFGEKFSPANLPVSIRDFNYNEISRLYSDQWGDYDGLTYSTWEVNPPNPTGYAPTMMVTCMNDAGPILDTRPACTGTNTPAGCSTTSGHMITDPSYSSVYSQFCYEIPFMPGQTQYMDTPVVPTAGFVGAGYNNPDCAYQNATPAIASAVNTSTEGSLPAMTGPWVSTAGHSITVTALGDQIVNNYGYSGPSAHTAPFNQKTVTRHYGFGATRGSVSLGGVNVAPSQITAWNDTTIVFNVPSNVPLCPVQQQAQYGGLPARCGELVITTAPSAAFPQGQKSVDTVTVTIGGKAPTVVATGSTIQSVIDAATPGDMIVVPPGTYDELLIMWKPVRLQGVGAASSIINANTHPAGITKLDPWRRSVNCLFGLALNGQPRSNTNPFDTSTTNVSQCPDGTTVSQTGPNGNTWNYFSGGPTFPYMAVDRLPREGVVGWDTTLNGNLAEMLQEPSLMGAYEGAAITVLSKGVNIPQGASDVFGNGAEADFPPGSTLLTGPASASGVFLLGDANPICTSGTGGNNPYPSNFQCNPSSIDGLGITNSSQGGGGIIAHGWAHNLQIANNRINNNAGTLSGGISVGQGEFPDAYLAPNSGVAAPGSCQDSATTNTQLPYCFFLHVNVHNNSITNNSSTGDELFTATPAGAGGASFTTGADYYQFDNNWVCGNLSTGDGGGLGHLGFIYNGDIEHNTFLFNQSTNPTIPTNGGGIIIMGAPPDGNQIVNGVLTECGTVTDVDCVPGLGDGAGPGLVINANLIMGNSAESGSGGGLRFQAVNGTDVSRFPDTPGNWYSATVTNNIIANNVAGWDGAGISLEDSLVVNIVNNTIMSNDSTASAGILFNTLGAPLASSQSPPSDCPARVNGTGSCPQPAGLVSLLNSPQLVSSFSGIGPITCPAGHYSGSGNNAARNGTCTRISHPILYNNIFWQNRTFDISVGGLGAGELNQQNVVALLNGLTGTRPASQASTGQCVNGSNSWDIGVRGDTGPTNHASGFTLNPQWSILTSIAGYNSGHNDNSNPAVISQYCNGARVPPENGGLGYQVPPGIADATVPNPIFSLTPAATVDEGNNWINMSWGPLSLTNPQTNAVIGNYSLQPGSPAVNFIECSNANAANGCQVIPDGNGPTITVPPTDFFGNPRPNPGSRRADAGAVQLQIGGGGGGGNNTPPATLTSIAPNSSTVAQRGGNVPVTLTGTNFTAGSTVSISGTGVTVVGGSVTVVSATQITATFAISADGGNTGAKNVTVTNASGTASNSVTFTKN